MAEVFKLGIAANNNQPIKEVNSIEVLKNKGIVGDRHFHDFNDPYNQLSLIEAENIDEYNIKFGLDIPYINFRRKVVTKAIQLNELIGKILATSNFNDNIISIDSISISIKELSLTKISPEDIIEILEASSLVVRNSNGTWTVFQ